MHLYFFNFRGRLSCVLLGLVLRPLWVGGDELQYSYHGSCVAVETAESSSGMGGPSVGRSRLKYLNDYQRDWQEGFYRHSLSPEDESHWRWWFSDLSSIVNNRSKLLLELDKPAIDRLFNSPSTCYRNSLPLQKTEKTSSKLVSPTWSLTVLI